MNPDQDRTTLEELAVARRRATGLLAAVTLVFVTTFFMPDTTLTGYVRAFAEAGMIGGLADWFAVVALFRHPLGIPIPHTAIIPNSKEAMGRNLASFVAHNFLDPALLLERLERSAPARSFGRWVSDPDHATAVSGQVAAVAAALAEGLGSEEVTADLERIITPQLEKLPYGQIAGRVVEATVERGHHRPLFDAAVGGLADVMVTNSDVLRERLGRESPWWVPEQVDDVVFARAFEGLMRFLLEVAGDPNHPLRRTVEDQLVALGGRLRDDDALNEQIGERVSEILEAEEVRAWMQGQWAAVAKAVSDAADREESELRATIADALVGFGKRLVDDDDLAARVDGWVASLAAPMAAVAQREAGTLIQSTMDHWDAEETSGRLELWLGRDLQFVRVNGTLVGGLAGLVIHTATLIAGG